jgi:hypothetical protein
MLGQLLDQTLVLLAAAVLLGVPGLSLVSLLRVRSALPDALAVPTAALLGSLVACAATALQLATSSPVTVAVGAHVGLSLVLAGVALAVERRRRASGTVVVPVARGWSRTTSALVLVAAAFAWLIRGSVRLDGLYHVALSRKLVELGEPTFNNINRFADGGPNPVYALPGWHAFVGWTGWVTGTDTVIAWEIMPVLVVALGALAAGGLARVLLDSARAEAVGVLAWVLMRVLFARREVDGDAIRYGAVPGQVTFELALPVVLAAIAVALVTADLRVRRVALGAAFAGIVATVIYHANYLPYVAIIGIGYAVWWGLASRRTPARLHDARRLLVVGGWVAAMAIACSAVLLPLLAQLENFGNAPDRDRIDYHLTETLGMAHARGGHAWEMFGLPGLVALVALPWLAWRLRNRVSMFAIVSGGVTALLAFSFVPPLFQLLRASGSLTLLLRINHAIGALLVVAFAALVLELADWVLRRGWSHRRRQLYGALVVAVLIVFGVVMGYDKFGPDAPGYLVFVALLGVLVAVAIDARRGARRRGSSEVDATLTSHNDHNVTSGSGPVGAREVDATLTSHHDHNVTSGSEPVACRGLVASVSLVLVLGLALPVGAISIRRGVENMDEHGVGIAQGDLICLGGPVAEAIQDEVADGSVVLSDPIASFRVMALAPVYVVGDYKVWNAATSDNRAEERLASVNRFFDSSVDDDARLAVLDEQGVDYLLVDLLDGRWLDEGWVDTSATQTLDQAWRGLDRFADVQTYDGGGIARLVQRNSDRFELLASDERGRQAALPEPTPDVEQPCQSYALWKVTS